MIDLSSTVTDEIASLTDQVSALITSRCTGGGEHFYASAVAASILVDRMRREEEVSGSSFTRRELIRMCEATVMEAGRQIVDFKAKALARQK